MKILIICAELPSSFNALTFRVLNSIEYLSQKYKHNITIISFKHLKSASKYDDEYLKKYCDEIETVGIPSSLFHRAIYHIINNMMGIPSRKMQIKINELLKREKFDVIFIDNPSMLFYASDVDLPKVLEIWAIPQIHYEAYKKLEKKMHKKLLRLWHYFQTKNYEKHYKKFDICITPTEHERDVLKSYLPDLEISVIPFGINTDLKFEDFEEDFPSLLFLGTLSSVFNQQSVRYLYKEVYPLIKEKIPDTKLYIVGKDPPEEIRKLSEDNPVIVTGYVKDVRLYLAHASVVTLPIHGFGIKTRLLEAMAMGKPVVVSSAGIHGIDVTPEKDIIVADDPREFAERVIELLNNEELRKKIGANARKLMEEEYSWEKMADMLNEVSQKVVNKRRK